MDESTFILGASGVVGLLLFFVVVVCFFFIFISFFDNIFGSKQNSPRWNAATILFAYVP